MSMNTSDHTSLAEQSPGYAVHPPDMNGDENDEPTRIEQLAESPLVAFLVFLVVAAAVSLQVWSYTLGFNDASSLTPRMTTVCAQREHTPPQVRSNDLLCSTEWVAKSTPVVNYTRFEWLLRHQPVYYLGRYMGGAP